MGKCPKCIDGGELIERRIHFNESRKNYDTICCRKCDSLLGVIGETEERERNLKMSLTIAKIASHLLD